MTDQYDDKTAYAFEAPDMRKLKSIEQRLYAPEPLTPDERRDLANIMNATLAHAVRIDC